MSRTEAVGLLAERCFMEKIIAYITSASAISSVIAVGVGVLLFFLLKKLYTRYIASDRSKGQHATFVRVAFSVARFMLIAITVLWVLQLNGVNVSSAVAGLGLLSAIIGLAIQDVLKDVIMGIHIMSDHFFAVGDVVRYKDIESVVVGFTMKTTTLRSTVDNTIITVCNRNISEITRLPKLLMIDIDVPLSYDEDFNHVDEVMRGISERIGLLSGVKKSSYKGTQEFEASAVVYRLRFFCPPEDKYERRREALRLIQSGLAEAGMQIPYNQLDVHTDAPVVHRDAEYY